MSESADHAHDKNRAEPMKSVLKPSFSSIFVPKLLTVLREGYGFSHFRVDCIAGLTVAIVALPLSIAIAIASGATPAQGLYTSIIGGFLVSFLGGSRFQIGGPAGAFIVVVATTVGAHGMDGLLLAMLMSGVFLSTLGFLRLGTYIKFIPYPVTIGFTAGIAVIIFSSQLINMLGLTLEQAEPGPIIPKLAAIVRAAGSINVAALVLCLGTIFFIQFLKHKRPQWPGMLLAVFLTSGVSAALSLDVATIGSKFGTMPAYLPWPSLPEVSLPRLQELLPAAIVFTLLGAIESLLSAVVADGMTGRRHRSNCELVGQGIANIVTAFFSGICVTGTIARTATNVRAGAHGPIAGMMHAVFLLVFMLVAAPFVGYIPLSCLAGILAVVSWNMIEKSALSRLLKASVGDAIVLLTTFALTIFWGLAEAIIIGFALGALLFIHRMSKMTEIVAHRPFVLEDKPDMRADRTPYEGGNQLGDLVIYRISGAFFFGAAASIGTVLDAIADEHRVLVIDFSRVPFLDATGANVMEGLAAKAKRRAIPLVVTGASLTVKKDMIAHGLSKSSIQFETNIEAAVAKYQTDGTAS